MTTLGSITENVGQPLKKPIRELAISLLDDEWGISDVAGFQLKDLLKDEGGNEDIIDAMEATEGRCYLPEGWKNTQST